MPLASRRSPSVAALSVSGVAPAAQSASTQCATAFMPLAAVTAAGRS